MVGSALSDLSAAGWLEGSRYQLNTLAIPKHVDESSQWEWGQVPAWAARFLNEENSSLLGRTALCCQTGDCVRQLTCYLLIASPANARKMLFVSLSGRER